MGEGNILAGSSFLKCDVSCYEEVDLVGVKVLCAVARILQQDPEIAMSEIKNSLPAPLAKHFVPEELLNLVAFVPADGVKEEFLGAIARIKARHREQHLEVLLAKARQNDLSDVDKVNLQRLLLEKSGI